MKISEIDKNLMVKTELSRDDVDIYDVCSAPFKVFGLILPQNDDDRFRRIPESVASKVSEGVLHLHSNTAGGRIRFKTDADYIALKAVMPSDKIIRMPHFAFAGCAGFDLYTESDGKQNYIHTFIPPMNMKDGFTSEFSNVPYPRMREYTLNMPLYADISKLYIILNKGANIEVCRDYRVSSPVVFYGSSITQGGCVSRPGNSYESIISRQLDCDYINLGFSGNAKAEEIMANYIASLDMSVFVYDYDYNAPNSEYLKKTHMPMFDIIRTAKKDIPIICISRPVTVWFGNKDEENERRKIIMNTVSEAKASGDKNVYFIDGADFASESYLADSISVDGCHPNDLGFMCMAKVIGEKIKEILNK